MGGSSPLRYYSFLPSPDSKVAPLSEIGEGGSAGSEAALGGEVCPAPTCSRCFVPRNTGVLPAAKRQRPTTRVL